MGVECLNQLGEVGERSGQPIDLIDDDDVDPSGLDINEQFLQGRPIYRAAGKAAIVVTVPDQPPALVSLALDVGLGRLTLGVEGIEVLLKPLVGRDAGVDRTAQAPPRTSRNGAGPRQAASPEASGRCSRSPRFSSPSRSSSDGRAFRRAHPAVRQAGDQDAEFRHRKPRF